MRYQFLAVLSAFMLAFAVLMAPLSAPLNDPAWGRAGMMVASAFLLALAAVTAAIEELIKTVKGDKKDLEADEE